MRGARNKADVQKRGQASSDDGNGLALTFTQPVEPAEVEEPDEEEEFGRYSGGSNSRRDGGAARRSRAVRHQRRGTGQLLSKTGREGPGSAAKWSDALETKFLLFWAGHKQDNCPVAVTGAALSIAGVSHFAQPNSTPAAPSPTWRGLASTLVVVTPPAVFPAASAVEGEQSERSCLFAFGALRHPVRLHHGRHGSRQ